MKMKKMFFAAAAVAMISLASCEKDWNCNCTTTDGNGNEVSSSTSSFTAKKDDAETSCDNLGASANTTCELKEQ